MAKVFVSYKRNIERDHVLADQIVRALQPRHQVFIDRQMLVGEDWVCRIQVEVEGADFLIVLLSEESIRSPMVAEEVRMAEAARKREGKPLILPVRLAYEGGLPYDLGAIVGRLNYSLWRGDSDGATVVREIEDAVSGTPLPARKAGSNRLAGDVPLSAANPRASIEAPEGTMSPDSQFYVERACDKMVAAELHRTGYTLTIRGPRQIGKSSLLSRVIGGARNAGKRVAFVDFQDFGQEAMNDPTKLYRQFAWLIEEALELDQELNRHWIATEGLAEPQRCRYFMEKSILPSCGAGGLLLAIDEVDSLLDSPLCSEFFGMLRSWHNRRANSSTWKNFALAMVISTEPSMLIKNLNQSPFNVGIRVPLDDFSSEELALVNRSHGEPLGVTKQHELQTLLGGHPYLTRRAFYELGRGRYSFGRLIDDADSENGPFGDHLRAVLSRLYRRQEMVTVLRRGLNGDVVTREQRYQLVAGGLVRGDAAGIVPRNRLYATFFKRVLYA